MHPVSQGSDVLGGHPRVPPLPAARVSPRGRALPRPTMCPLQWPPCSGHPEDLPMGALLRCTQSVRPQLPGGGARLLSQLRPRAGRYPLQPGHPGTLRGWPLPGAFAGYWNVTLIPEGARHIRAAHRSRNHLALMGGDGRYVFNGNWAVSPPGTYEAAGTSVVYTRVTGSEETLRAAGPTSEDLLLQVLLQEPNPGVEFEFWLPRERYGPFQAQAQAQGWSLRQSQPREVDPRSPDSPAAPTVIPPRTPGPTPGELGTAWAGASREAKPVPLTALPPQTPAHPALTPAVVPTGCSTIAAATLCSGPACWAASSRPRRPDTRCACSSSTRTVRRCGPSSMCGRRATAPAHRWPSIGTTCWRPGASSAPMALRTGCCSPMPATPGPGAPPRTAACAWSPDTAPSEPLDQTSPHTAGQAQSQHLSPLAIASRELRTISHLQLCDSPPHTLRHPCTQSDPLSEAGTHW
nr:ADAMTS-like protein 5 isoform X7 [Kogia breviceps]